MSEYPQGLTDFALRVRVAQLDGYHVEADPDQPGLFVLWRGEMCMGWRCGETIDDTWDQAFMKDLESGSADVPDYPNDLDAAYAVCVGIADATGWLFSCDYRRAPERRWHAVFEERVGRNRYRNNAGSHSVRSAAHACALAAWRYGRVQQLVDGITPANVHGEWPGVS